ncbi:hypothetical protein J2X63_000332 [Agromyces sp. 3263]|uniref:DUF7657 domain-containing protein n=1 Tax=Agromyces sp. 3263 TaxID=2817750 RepID=UPI002863B73D|nr:hypothetical protein [Agromyces sp. 3263]MDR6904646.1 hypothetical protein [Agromyces sp. 3263]
MPPLRSPRIRSRSADDPRSPLPAWRWLIFPGIVLVMLVSMVAADLNGSSIGAFSESPSEHGLLLGHPLGVRSDEYLLETPNALSSAQQGMPTSAWIGLADVDQAVAAGGGPTLDWSTSLKPQDWGFVLLDPSHGLSWNWWFPFAVCLWGTFALIGLITRRPGLSAVLAIAATFTPYSAWWMPDLLVGFAALAGAAIIGAWTTSSRVAAALLSVAAACSAGALALVLYPPWQYSLALVIVAICLGFALDRRIAWRRVLWTSGIAIAGAAAVLSVWIVQHSAAAAAVAGTYYPGQRRTVAGGGSLAVITGAPLNFWMVGDAGASLGAGGEGGQFSNLSEAASSWIPFPVLALVVAAAIGLAWRDRRRRRAAGVPVPSRGADDQVPEPVWTILLPAGLIALLLAWTFLPLPSWFGVITQLQRVQPSRTTLAIGFASVLMMAAATAVRSSPRVWSWPWLGAAAVIGAVGTVWSAENLPWNAELVPTTLAALSGFVLTGLFALLLWKRWAIPAAAGLAVYAFVSWSLVNPLQQGIAPLSDDPLVRELHSVADAGENPRTLVFGDLATVARARAAGFQSVSGTTPYPDAQLMGELAPAQEELWNNYAQYEWTPDPDPSAARIERVTGSLMQLSISPCNPVVAERADPAWVVSETSLEDYECLVPLTQVDGVGDATLHIYRFESPR